MQDALHVEARIWPFTSKKEETGDDDEDDELCVDPKSCGVKGPKPKRCVHITCDAIEGSLCSKQACIDAPCVKEKENRFREH